MTALEIIGIITAGTAFIGAFAGLGGMIISYKTLQRSYWTKNVRVKVDGRESFISGVKKSQFSIKIANLGERNFTISMLSIKIGRRSGSLVILKPQSVGFTVPYELEPGKTANYWSPMGEIEKSIKESTKRSRIKIRAQVTDYLGSTFDAKPFTVILRRTRRDQFKEWFKAIKNSILNAIWP